jgi:hypothetical protein
MLVCRLVYGLSHGTAIDLFQSILKPCNYGISVMTNIVRRVLQHYAFLRVRLSKRTPQWRTHDTPQN